MDLPAGGKIILQSGESQRKIEGIYIGSDPSAFMVVHIPGNPNLQVKVGQSFPATYMSEGIIYRVHSTVLAFVEKLDLLVLSYPVSFEKESLRTEPRINCSIPATANIEKNALKGLITDISKHGCQFIVKIPATFKLYRISVLTDINLSLAMLGGADPTNLKGKVRNTSIDEFKIALGIEFEKMEEQISHRLNHFIDNLRVVQ